MKITCLMFLFIPIMICLGHSVPGLKEDGHYKDGKHNDEYDQKAFLGNEQHKEFIQLSTEERKERLGKIVEKIDKNGDGNITEDELTDWIKYIALKEPTDSTKKYWSEVYGEYLADDGLVSWEELVKVNFPVALDEKSRKRKEAARRKFVAADKDKDNKLSFNEFLAYRHMGLFPHMYDVFVAEVIEEMDSDGDGVITLKDVTKKARGRSEEDNKRNFEYRDVNNDKTLDKDEMKEWYFPTTYDTNRNEAHHIILSADTDKNKVLTKKEIMDNYEIFVGSKATHWGDTLQRPTDEL